MDVAFWLDFSTAPETVPDLGQISQDQTDSRVWALPWWDAWDGMAASYFLGIRGIAWQFL